MANIPLREAQRDQLVELLIDLYWDQTEDSQNVDIHQLGVSIESDASGDTHVQIKVKADNDTDRQGQSVLNEANGSIAVVHDLYYKADGTFDADRSAQALIKRGDAISTPGLWSYANDFLQPNLGRQTFENVLGDFVKSEILPVRILSPISPKTLVVNGIPTEISALLSKKATFSVDLKQGGTTKQLVAGRSTDANNLAKISFTPDFVGDGEVILKGPNNEVLATYKIEAQSRLISPRDKESFTVETGQRLEIPIKVRSQAGERFTVNLYQVDATDPNKKTQMQSLQLEPSAAGDIVYVFQDTTSGNTNFELEILDPSGKSLSKNKISVTLSKTEIDRQVKEAIANGNDTALANLLALQLKALKDADQREQWEGFVNLIPQAAMHKWRLKVVVTYNSFDQRIFAIDIVHPNAKTKPDALDEKTHQFLRWLGNLLGNGQITQAPGHITIESHTDILGSDKVNQQVSKERTRLAQADLQSGFKDFNDTGLADENFELKGLGKTETAKEAQSPAWKRHPERKHTQVTFSFPNTSEIMLGKPLFPEKPAATPPPAPVPVEPPPAPAPMPAPVPVEPPPAPAPVPAPIPVEPPPAPAPVPAPEVKAAPAPVPTDTEATARAEAEARAKAEGETRAKAEAEARAQAEAQARAEAEARAQAEAAARQAEEPPKLSKADATQRDRALGLLSRAAATTNLQTRLGKYQEAQRLLAPLPDIENVAELKGQATTGISETEAAIKADEEAKAQARAEAAAKAAAEAEAREKARQIRTLMGQAQDKISAAERRGTKKDDKIARYTEALAKLNAVLGIQADHAEAGQLKTEVTKKLDALRAEAPAAEAMVDFNAPDAPPAPVIELTADERLNLRRGKAGWDNYTTAQQNAQDVGIQKRGLTDAKAAYEKIPAEKRKHSVEDASTETVEARLTQIEAALAQILAAEEAARRAAAAVISGGESAAEDSATPRELSAATKKHLADGQTQFRYYEIAAQMNVSPEDQLGYLTKAREHFVAVLAEQPDHAEAKGRVATIDTKLPELESKVVKLIEPASGTTVEGQVGKTTEILIRTNNDAVLTAQVSVGGVIDNNAGYFAGGLTRAASKEHRFVAKPNQQGPNVIQIIYKGRVLATVTVNAAAAAAAAPRAPVVDEWASPPTYDVKNPQERANWYQATDKSLGKVKDAFGVAINSYEADGTPSRVDVAFLVNADGTIGKIIVTSIGGISNGRQIVEERIYSMIRQWRFEPSGSTAPQQVKLFWKR
ncbi:MAG: hypothetical protein HYT76_03665 [Deltaproteobacteria bacterium]|nr:hypothetical protein [Deltaproteobacteria bacterium]